MPTLNSALGQWPADHTGLPVCGRHAHQIWDAFEQGQGQAAVADLGGSIITGIDGNPLAVLAAQLDIPLHAIDTAGVPLYLEDGRVPHPAVDKKVATFCAGRLFIVSCTASSPCSTGTRCCIQGAHAQPVQRRQLSGLASVPQMFTASARRGSGSRLVCVLPAGGCAACLDDHTVRNLLQAG